MTLTEIQNLAQEFPHTELSGHMGQEDIRVKGKIFITFKEDGVAVLKLTPEQQAMVLETSSNQFEPVSGGWGQKGWTRFDYANANQSEVKHALQIAWRNVAQKRMISAFDEAQQL